MQSKQARTRYFDLQDKLISGKSRAKAPVDPESKKKALHAIALAHGTLMKATDATKERINDVGFWNGITSQLATGFVIFKQGLRNQTGFAQKLSSKRAAADTPTLPAKKKKPNDDVQMEEDDEPDRGQSYTTQPGEGFTATPKFLGEIWIRVTTVVYGKPPTKDDEFIGTINSLLCLMNGFSRRLNESMYPNGDIKFGVEENVDKKYRPSAFGLDETHFHLLSGITISPHARSGLAMTLSPLTIAIILSLSPNNKYQEKWKRAFRQAFGLFDDVDKLAEFVATSGKQSTQIFRLLATAVEYGLVRANNKTYIPWVLINAAYPLTNFTTPETYHYQHVDELAEMDFSGKGMWALWNKACTKRFTWHYSANERVCQQMFIHGVFDTHHEDLTIPEYMFGITFNRRNELVSDLDKKKFKLMEFSLPTPNYICKLANAATSKNTGGGVGQQSRAPVFAGNCYQELGPQSFLVSRMEKGPRAVTSNMDPVDKLEARLANAAKVMADNKKIDFGNTAFFKNQPSKKNPYGDEGEQEAQQPLKLLGRYFLQRV